VRWRRRSGGLCPGGQLLPEVHGVALEHSS
jgi:hypothetical protein